MQKQRQAMPRRGQREKVSQADQSKTFIEKAREIGAGAAKNDDEAMWRLAGQAAQRS
jgi:hypothetical protein